MGHQGLRELDPKELADRAKRRALLREKVLVADLEIVAGWQLRALSMVSLDVLLPIARRKVGVVDAEVVPTPEQGQRYVPAVSDDVNELRIRLPP